MIRLSRKSLLALEAVLDIAFYGRMEPIQAKEITARQGVPTRYLEQVMQHLAQVGILKGVRGPRGGYMLARERRRIKVSEVLQALAEMEARDENEPTSESDLGQNIVAPLWDDASAKFMEAVADVTIEDLCQRAHALGVRRPDEADGQEDADFAI